MPRLQAVFSKPNFSTLECHTGSSAAWPGGPGNLNSRQPAFAADSGADSFSSQFRALTRESRPFELAHATRGNSRCDSYSSMPYGHRGSAELHGNQREGKLQSLQRTYGCGCFG